MWTISQALWHIAMCDSKVHALEVGKHNVRLSVSTIWVFHGHIAITYHCCS